MYIYIIYIHIEYTYTRHIRRLHRLLRLLHIHTQEYRNSLNDCLISYHRNENHNMGIALYVNSTRPCIVGTKVQYSNNNERNDRVNNLIAKSNGREPHCP